MIGIGINERAECGDGGVLLAIFPLQVRQQDGGAARGVGVSVFIDHRLKGRQIPGFVEQRTCGLLAAFLDAAVNDQSGGAEGQHDGEDHQVFLVVVEKLLEGAWAVGDFCKR